MKEIGAVTGLEALNLTAVVKLSLTGDGYSMNWSKWRTDGIAEHLMRMVWCFKHSSLKYKFRLSQNNFIIIPTKIV